MAQESWVNSRESMRAHFQEMAKHQWTVEDNLAVINEIRAQSGDQPLTLARYLENLENLKRGIYPWDQPAPQNFFARLRLALKKGRAAFHQAMQKN